MARGYKTWIRKQEGYVEPFVETVRHELNDYLKGRLSLEEWGPIEPGRLRWVMNAFCWSSTEEGASFWCDVHFGRGDQELACEILRSWKAQLCP